MHLHYMNLCERLGAHTSRPASPSVYTIPLIRCNCCCCYSDISSCCCLPVTEGFDERFQPDKRGVRLHLDDQRPPSRERVSYLVPISPPSSAPLYHQAAKSRLEEVPLVPCLCFVITTRSLVPGSNQQPFSDLPCWCHVVSGGCERKSKPDDEHLLPGLSQKRTTPHSFNAAPPTRELRV